MCSGADCTSIVMFSGAGGCAGSAAACGGSAAACAGSAGSADLPDGRARSCVSVDATSPRPCAESSPCARHKRAPTTPPTTTTVPATQTNADVDDRPVVRTVVCGRVRPRRVSTCPMLPPSVVSPSRASIGVVGRTDRRPVPPRSRSVSRSGATGWPGSIAVPPAIPDGVRIAGVIPCGVRSGTGA